MSKPGSFPLPCPQGRGGRWPRADTLLQVGRRVFFCKLPVAGCMQLFFFFFFFNGFSWLQLWDLLSKVTQCRYWASFETL
jgi:hypothetical protein